jgi:lipopolysaccharide/colanic/teichoic acid biosynthesis glycosyltransferase
MIGATVMPTQDIKYNEFEPASEQIFGNEISRSASAIKRVMDLAIGLPLLITVSPFLLLIAIALKLDSPGPVFFRQERIGRRFRPFTMIKFRTLRQDMPDPHSRYEMREDDPRITRVGAFLRNTSLDELPQLYNVITGSMSLVGPRPLVEWESRETLRKHAARFEVKPGITGLSQITVRNSVDLDSRSDVDVEYVGRWSPLLDLEVLLRTPAYVLTRSAIYPDA